MIGFLADLFPKQVINDKSTFLTENLPYVSAGSVTIEMGLNCSLGLHMPKKFTYITGRSVLSHIIIFYSFSNQNPLEKIMNEKKSLTSLS